MSGVITRMELVKELPKRYPQIEEIYVNEDFDFLDSNPPIFFRCKGQVETLSLLADVSGIFEGFPMIYIGYNIEDLLFAGKKTLWFNNKIFY